jgi:hypothetical protein
MSHNLRVSAADVSGAKHDRVHRRVAAALERNWRRWPADEGSGWTS